MNRRTFTRLAGTGLAWPLTGPYPNRLHAKEALSVFIDQLIAANDARIPDILSRQQVDETHRWYGGIKSRTEVYYPGHAAGFIRNLCCGYIAQESEYYGSDVLLKAMILASVYLLKAQYDDGNIDLPSTNFHSPPDTAFAVEPLCIAYSLLSNFDGEAVLPLMENLKKFLVHAGESLSIGGIHTANHRWVVCMALARLNALFPNPAYLRRIDAWLAEKIDIDPDGQYAERSTLIYTPLVNRCLITIARLADKPELFDPVRKNLEMTLYYIHPNGEIATESSGRQDRYQQGTMENYWYAYRYMAILDSNNRFAAMSGKISELGPGKLGFWLSYLLEDPFLSNELPAASSLPEYYVKEFYHSDLIRIRRGPVDATILGNNPSFFTLFKGKAALESVRLATAFFGKGQFRSQTMEHQGDMFVLQQKLVGPYYQPLTAEDIPEEGNGWQVSRIRRAQSEVQEQEVEIRIAEQEGRLELQIRIYGADNVPVAVELAFRHGGRFDLLERVDSVPDAKLARKGAMMRYTFGGDVITFGPGIREHAWTQLRGALPKLDADCVYFTGFAPIDFTIEIF